MVVERRPQHHTSAMDRSCFAENPETRGSGSHLGPAHHGNTPNWAITITSTYRQTCFRLQFVCRTVVQLIAHDQYLLGKPGTGKAFVRAGPRSSASVHPTSLLGSRRNHAKDIAPRLRIRPCRRIRAGPARAWGGSLQPAARHDRHREHGGVGLSNQPTTASSGTGA